MFEMSGFGFLAYLLFAFLILGIASFIKYLSTPTPRPSEDELVPRTPNHAGQEAANRDT